MRRLIFLPFLIFLSLLLGCAGTQAIQTTPIQSAPVASVQDLIGKTVALVDPTDAGGVRAYCSGVWVSRYNIVTANHCMQGEPVGSTVNYVVYDDIYLPGDLNEKPLVTARSAKFVAADTKHDVALLVAAYPPAHAIAPISMDAVRPGQRVYTMGAPLGQYWSYSSGDVAAVRYLHSLGEIEAVFVQATAPISGGNSGGGLFNDFGELMGICHAGFTKGQNMNLWIHYQYVDAILRSNG